MTKLLNKLKMNFFLFIITVTITTFITPTDAYAWTVKSVTSRTDGTWLFPISSSNYFALSDWAGCSANYYGNCIFGCSHANWGDYTHSSRLGHYGLDIACGNVPILASASGTAYRGYCSGRGNYIVIEHPLNDGSNKSYYSVYQHLASFSVANETKVSTGAQIGIAGNSGTSIGVHLHFEILLLNSGLGQALTNTNTLATYEGQGWIRTSSQSSGLLVTNPSTSNYADNSSCNLNSKVQYESIPYHCGSITYTYNKSSVSIGNKTTTPVTSKSHATKAQAANWVSSRIGELATDMNGDNICTSTDFIKEYSRFLGLSELNGTPADYSTMTLPAGYTRIKNWTGADGFIPQPGDIAIWIGGSYGNSGHAGIVLGADGWYITQLAELTGSKAQGTSTIAKRINDNYSYFWGVIRPIYSSSITKRTVSFKDYNGSLLKMQIVNNNSSATPPSNPTRLDCAFLGWDGNYTNVAADTTITPIYTPVSAIKPTTLTSLTATLYGHDDVKLSWSKVSNATGYAIYYKTNKADSVYKKVATTKSTSYTFPNLTDGLKYTFKVAPYRTINGTNYWSNNKTVSKYTLKKLATPTIKKYSSKKVTVIWKKISGVSGYQVSKSSFKSTTVIAKTLSSNYQSYTLSTAKNKTYYYKVRSYKIENGKKIYGPWSSVKAYNLK